MEYDVNFLLGILEHLDIGIFVLDAAGNYLYVNSTYCNLFNRTPESFLNDSIPNMKEMSYLSTSVWEQIVQKKAPVVALMTIVHKEVNLTYHHFTSGFPTFNEDGSIKYIYYLIEPLESINKRIQEGILNKRYFMGNYIIPQVTNTGVIAESPKMKQLISMLSTVSKTDASILFTGPTGSGKQVLAEYAHRISARSKGPFISIDCVAIPENLLESELFGYVRGAFTGASNEGKKGQIELADGGTLFLDEINSMSLALQGKLLRVLETKNVKRIGASEGKPINFRLMCASNENLEALVQNGSFRSDLYYRISVVPIHIPPLRERKEDIIQLSFMFLQLFCNKYSCIKVLSEEALNAISAYEWPGNVRELRNFIERIVVTTPDTDVEVDTLPDWLLQSTFHPTQNIPQPDLITMSPSYSDDFSFHSYMERCEKQLMQEALINFKTPAKIAEVLKLDLSNVYRKLRKHKISPDQKK